MALGCTELLLHACLPEVLRMVFLCCNLHQQNCLVGAVSSCSEVRRPLCASLLVSGLRSLKAK